MSRIDLLIDQIIKRAQNTAEDLFKSFPKGVETGLSFTHLSKEEFIKMRLEEITTHKKGVTIYYNVRDVNHLRNILFMDIDSKAWPLTGTAKMRNPTPGKMYCRKFHVVLWPLFLQVKRIDYLNSLIEQKHYKTGLHSKLSDEQLKSVYTAFKNKYFATTTEKQFFAAFRPDPLPEGWQPIKWTGFISNIRYFVSLVTGTDYKPEQLFEFVTPKIKKNDQTKPKHLRDDFKKAIE